MSETETQADEPTMPDPNDKPVPTEPQVDATDDEDDEDDEDDDDDDDDEDDYTITGTEPGPGAREFSGGGKTLDEAQQLVKHRDLVRQALGVYHKAAETCRKHEEAIGNSTRETDRKLAQCDMLIDLLGDQTDLGLAGTPLGDAIAEGVSRAGGGASNGKHGGRLTEVTDPDDIDDFGRTPKDRAKAKGKGTRGGAKTAAKKGAKRGRKSRA